MPRSTPIMVRGEIVHTANNLMLGKRFIGVIISKQLCNQTCLIIRDEETSKDEHPRHCSCLFASWAQDWMGHNEKMAEPSHATRKLHGVPTTPNLYPDCTPQQRSIRPWRVTRRGRPRGPIPARTTTPRWGLHLPVMVCVVWWNEDWFLLGITNLWLIIGWSLGWVF